MALALTLPSLSVAQEADDLAAAALRLKSAMVQRYVDVCLKRSDGNMDFCKSLLNAFHVREKTAYGVIATLIKDPAVNEFQASKEIGQCSGPNHDYASHIVCLEALVERIQDARKGLTLFKPAR